jgi:uncharacterized coiled-coil DUF342 family protein
MTDAATSTPAPAATAPDAAAAPVAETDVRNLQAKFNHLIEQRNQFNDLARAAREMRDQLNEQRRTKSAEIEEHKVARDAANEGMRQHKERRNQYQEQAKALIAQKKGKTEGVERSLPLQVRKLRNDLQAMIEQQQTTQLTVQKERVLVEKISEAWKELKAKEQELQKQKAVEVDLSDTDEAINQLFAKADEEHEKVVAFMKQAQEHHEKFIAGVKEIRILVGESNKKHEEFVACKTKADESHNNAMELREKVMAVREMKKAEYDAQRREVREINTQAKRSVADPKVLDRLKDDAFEQLKKGGKITLGF